MIAPSAAARRLFARVMWRMTRGFWTLAFAAADTHAHLEVARCGRRDAGELARRIELSLGRVLELPVGFEPARIKEIRDQGHLGGVFRYTLRQDRHHGVDVDPMRDATNLPDLLGLRIGGEHTVAAVRELLPRVQREELMSFYEPLGAPGEIVLADLADAAAASVARDLRDPRAARARVAAVHAVDASTQELALALGLDARSVRRLRQRRPDNSHVVAIQRQLLLRARLRGRRQKIHTGSGSLAAVPIGVLMT
ncbi:MAG TPA: hypothetical protein VFB62_24035 [Polyangiaceae bacterium]|nr:hypothetical protein [Polyangiaceae bacterium]